MSLKICLPLNELDEDQSCELFETQLEEAPRREVTFFDEAITGYIYLQGESSGSQASIRVGVSPIDGPNTPLLQTITSLTPLFPPTPTLTVWRFSFPVTYPKQKVAEPYVHLTATVDMSLALAVEPRVVSTPAANVLANLLFLAIEPKRSSPLVSFSIPSLSLGRSLECDNLPRVPESLSAAAHVPVYPALTMRLKSTKSSSRDSVLFSTLELEASKELNRIGVALDILSVDTTFTDGTCEAFTPNGFCFPMPFLPDDILNLTHKLSSTTGGVRPIQISILSRARWFAQGEAGEIFGGVITTSWSTNVDFSINAPSLKPKRQTKAAPRLASSLNVAVPRSAHPALAGLVITFSGQTDVELGETFVWNVQAVNKSANRLHLSLYIQTRDVFEKPVPKLPGKDFTLYPVAGLQKMYSALKLRPQGILPLANDIKIGPLDPGAVFETKIELMAIERGMYNLEGVRIIDVGSGEGFDCGKLLEVVVI